MGFNSVFKGLEFAEVNPPLTRIRSIRAPHQICHKSPIKLMDRTVQCNVFR